MYNRPNYVYGLYASNGQLIYVGQTCNPGSRWLAHRTSRRTGKVQEWARLTGDTNVEFRVIGVYNDDQHATIAEYSIMKAVKPALNKEAKYLETEKKPRRQRQAHSKLLAIP